MDVIGELLRSSLLTDLGDDEERVSKVRAAASDLAESFLGSSRPLVPRAVLAAVDEDGSSESTPLTRAGEHLMANWETFKNAFPDTPTELLRGVALAAIAQAAEKSQEVRGAAWYSMRTARERVRSGRWADATDQLMAHWQTEIDAAIEKCWSPAPASSSLRMPSVRVPAEGTTIHLNTTLRDRAQQTAASGNYSTFSQQLMTDFVRYMNDLIQGAEVLAGEATRRSAAQLKDFASELGARLRDAIVAHEQSVLATRLRTDVLWWRQAAFSPTLAKSYSVLQAPADVAIAAAVDLHRLVPGLAPIALEHVLADLVAAFAQEDVDLSQLSASSELHLLPQAALELTPPLLIDAVQADGNTTPVLNGSSSLTAAEVAVLIFRDLQATRLASTPEPSPEES